MKIDDKKIKELQKLQKLIFNKYALSKLYFCAQNIKIKIQYFIK